jgi:hypothetical protein
MIIYSKRTISFINELKREIKTILSVEMGLKVNRERFFNPSGTSSYPISVVIYNHRSMLGYFDAAFYELGFHERLMHSNKEQVYNIIRHELAHYLTFILYGNDVRAHGSLFRTVCCRFGWGPEVYEATVQLIDSEESLLEESSNVLRKVQKLMALAGSSNANEAEQAMIKSQQLLLKHNIEFGHSADPAEERFFAKRIMKRKKRDAKMSAIAKIVETFFVNIIYNHSSEFVYLELLGNAVNLEIAEYVADVLDTELDKLWETAKVHAKLRGTTAKNSFYHGIAIGYLDKINALKRSYQNDATNALMVIEKKLTQAKEMAYKRLVSTKSRGNFCPTASAVGEQMGRQLTINPGLSKGSSNSAILRLT